VPAKLIIASHNKLCCFAVNWNSHDQVHVAWHFLGSQNDDGFCG